MTLWEEQVHRLEEGKSYLLNGLLMQEYACKKNIC